MSQGIITMSLQIYFFILIQIFNDSLLLLFIFSRFDSIFNLIFFSELTATDSDTERLVLSKSHHDTAIAERINKQTNQQTERHSSGLYRKLYRNQASCVALFPVRCQSMSCFVCQSKVTPLCNYFCYVSISLSSELKFDELPVQEKIK